MYIEPSHPPLSPPTFLVSSNPNYNLRLGVYFLSLSHFSLLKFPGLSLEQLNFYYAYLNKYLENYMQ